MLGLSVDRVDNLLEKAGINGEADRKQPNDRKQPIALRCVAEGSGDRWEAICLDFDLAVQGTSDEEVIAKLRSAIKDYIDYVHSLPQDQQERFLTRRVPWYVRAGLVAKALFAFVRHSRHDTKGRYSYSVPCAV